jgi:hypothetical protein
MANIFDTIHSLIDATRFHSEQQALDAHDSVTAHVEGFKSLEEYRRAKAAASPTDTAGEDAILEKAAEIQKQREAQAAANAEQQTQIAARAQAQRPAAPAAVEGTPSSPTADPDAAPTL